MTSASFSALGCLNSVTVLDPSRLERALDIATAVLDEIDLACSRFRADSDLSRLNASPGAEQEISPLLAEALAVALRTAEMTGGLVDPTVGGRLLEIGYTVTFRDVPPVGPPIRITARTSPDWRAVKLGGNTVSVPEGVLLDLGASGKAWAADRVAQTVAEQLGTPVAFSCGGDVAIAGPPAPWPIRIEPSPGEDPAETVLLDRGGLASSGPGARRWRRGRRDLHHIIDPATGRPADTPWRMVTVSGATCVDANAAATAAVILGSAAPAWLERRQLPARLVDEAGAVVRTGGWAA